MNGHYQVGHYRLAGIKDHRGASMKRLAVNPPRVPRRPKAERSTSKPRRNDPFPPVRDP
jgi:hypothetical protein